MDLPSQGEDCLNSDPPRVVRAGSSVAPRRTPPRRDDRPARPDGPARPGRGRSVGRVRNAGDQRRCERGGRAHGGGRRGGGDRLSRRRHRPARERRAMAQARRCDTLAGHRGGCQGGSRRTPTSWCSERYPSPWSAGLRRYPWRSVPCIAPGSYRSSGSRSR